MPLPFAQQLSSPKLRGSDSITFDPLGVAAILQNPRADLSAARLYVQSDRHAFRWPHTTMIGAALTPVAALASHLASYESIHPAVSMCTRDERSISVISDTVIRDLRVNVSNLWIRDVINFKGSRESSRLGSVIHKSGNAGNDFAIVVVKDIFDQSSLSAGHPRTLGFLWRKGLLEFTGLLTGILLSIGVCFSILTGDIWGLTLFLLYLFHWIASTLISFTYLVETTCPRIRPDATMRFLVHERPADIGGTVVFKGTQHELETWARTTLQFRPNLLAPVLHWLWLITGTLAAISSIACMVNMTGIFQLVFLGVLFYSSLAELWLTQCSRRMQREIRKMKDMSRVSILTNSKSRTEAIIRATVEVGETCSLRGLDWIGLQLLPPLPILIEFQKMLALLADENGSTLETVLADFRQRCELRQRNSREPHQNDAILIDRIVNEAREIVFRKTRQGNHTSSASHEQQQEKLFTA